MSYNGCFNDYFYGAIERINKEGRYRSFLSLDRGVKDFPCATLSGTDRQAVVWCSNDYLGMSCHPDLVKASAEASYNFGVGSGGTRNISGTHSMINKLEMSLADLHGKDKALVFSSGYIANTCTIGVLIKLVPGLVIFSDQDNHASIIDGICSNGAQKIYFQT